MSCRTFRHNQPYHLHVKEPTTCYLSLVQSDKRKRRSSRQSEQAHERYHIGFYVIKGSMWGSLDYLDSDNWVYNPPKFMNFQEHGTELSLAPAPEGYIVIPCTVE